MSTRIFDQGAFAEAQRWIEADPANRYLSVGLMSGVDFALPQLTRFEGHRLVGVDVLGTMVYVSVDQIESFAFVEDTPIDLTEPEDQNEAEWQVAFMELRAACDESDDPRVKEAAGRLDRIEVARMVEAEAHDQ